ncbi:MAG: hypothetical protein ACREBV_07925, partial [Candidatus Zixiibacteriota bacterium]
MAGFKMFPSGQIRRCQTAFAFLLLSILPYTGFGLDYTIKEVIEVGEADFVPFLGPLKWSPDGTMIAFTKGGVLKVSDTLGNVREVAKLKMGAHRFDWLSNDRIAVQLKAYPGPVMSTENKIILIDVTTGIETSVHEYKTTPDHKTEPGIVAARGPFRSVESSLYYELINSDSTGKNQSVERISFLDNKGEAIRHEHFLRWSDNRLYLVRLDESDSTWLVSK